MGFPNRIHGLRKGGALPLPFDPVNALERVLHAFIRGEGPIEAVLRGLLESRVVVLLEGEGRGLEAERLLVLPGRSGAESLCVFTSPQRSQGLREGRARPLSPRWVDFQWVIESAPHGLGLAINPGLPVSLEQSPEGFARLRRDFSETAPPGGPVLG
jgi:hypothetical protein